MADPKDKGGLAIVIGGEPKGEKPGFGAPKAPEGDDRRTLAGTALGKAFRRGDAVAIMDALEEALSVLDGDDEMEEPELDAESAEGTDF